MRPFDLLYHVCWTTAALVLLPQRLLTGRNGPLRRLLWEPPAERLPPGGVWLHALSVGEVISAVPLAEAIRGAFPGRPLIVSASTEKGLAVARADMTGKASAVLSMPMDFWWSVRRMIAAVNPSIFVLVETDVWPGLIGFLKARGVPAILVNGRVSPRTFHGYSRAAPLLKRVFAPFCLCLMQSERDRRRLVKAGVVEEERVQVAGNIKFDGAFHPMEAAERAELLEQLGLSSEDTIWVAGSTHPGEEESLLEVYSSLRPDHPDLRLVMAPRDVARAPALLAAARLKGLSARLRTAPSGAEQKEAEVVILDSVGELARFYGLGAFAFVGGSLVPVGGHNLLEPARFGCPVLFGPHTHNFADMAEQLLEAGGGLRVEETASLGSAVAEFLSNDRLRRQMGRRAKEFVLANRGALDRVVEWIGRCGAERLP